MSGSRVVAAIHPQNSRTHIHALAPKIPSAKPLLLLHATTLTPPSATPPPSKYLPPTRTHPPTTAAVSPPPHLSPLTSAAAAAAAAMFRSTPLVRTLRPLVRRAYSSSAPAPTTNATTIHDTGSTDPAPLQESAVAGQEARVQQAPNRQTTWSRSQQPRELAMVGPRFEQTILERQPAPYAAIELIHQQPVRWSEKRVVACDGGGGPMGHPRVFINVDKPEIVPCGYCGLPFAHVHHKESLAKLEKTDYPLE